ncbi:hypothetical protein HK100_004454, partial [Physocladia obscura]
MQEEFIEESDYFDSDSDDSCPNVSMTPFDYESNSDSESLFNALTAIEFLSLEWRTDDNSSHWLTCVMEFSFPFDTAEITCLQRISIKLSIICQENITYLKINWSNDQLMPDLTSNLIDLTENNSGNLINFMTFGDCTIDDDRYAALLQKLSAGVFGTDFDYNYSENDFEKLVNFFVLAAATVEAAYSWKTLDDEKYYFQ